MNKIGFVKKLNLAEHVTLLATEDPNHNGRGAEIESNVEVKDVHVPVVL
jgi:hypothetical protein